MKTYDLDYIKKIVQRYGSPLYVFDEKAFVQNYKNLEEEFRSIYPKYNIAYSFKTNYSPYIVSLVKKLGGFAEVVSGMEYYIAQKTGYKSENIIFNGPNKETDGVSAFLDGCKIQIDNMHEAIALTQIAQEHQDKKFEVAVRVNADVGQSFISRFGIDESELDCVFSLLREQLNISVVGLHCHISRCRSIEKWKLRAEKMLALADKYFCQPPQYIDLGSGMFGTMDPEFAEQFENVPSYHEYATVVAGAFARHYADFSEESKPILITEPGTTLINHFVDLISEGDAIKTIRGKAFAVLNCSEHNLGETCTLKDLPIRIVSTGGTQSEFSNIDFTGYTCLEQDVMRRNVTCKLAVGDYIVFGNVGGYSNVLKPPFIRPNCAMIAVTPDNKDVLIKGKETYDDILVTYCF